MFSRQEVREMVDALFHEFASGSRIDASERLTEIMDTLEALKGVIKIDGAWEGNK